MNLHGWKSGVPQGHRAPSVIEHLKSALQINKQAKFLSDFPLHCSIIKLEDCGRYFSDILFGLEIWYMDPNAKYQEFLQRLVSQELNAIQSLIMASENARYRGFCYSCKKYLKLTFTYDCNFAVWEVQVEGSASSKNASQNKRPKETKSMKGFRMRVLIVFQIRPQLHNVIAFLSDVILCGPTSKAVFLPFSRWWSLVVICIMYYIQFTVGA